MPAETARHERTVMCWPTRIDLYGELMPAARLAHAEVATTIARYEPVTMIARPGEGDAAEAACGPEVEVVELAIDDSWFRDTGPIYVVSADGQRVALDWEFNGWGGKFAPWEDDATIGRRWAEHAGHPTRTIPVVMEGGSLAVDGAGTLVTTAECLMHPNRNPGLTRRDLEAVLVSELGVSTIIWLPHGLALDRDTDGHVDNVAAFAAPARLVMQGCDDRSEADWARCNINARCASHALDARDDPIEVVELPVLPYTVVGGRRVAVPYLNYYVANGVVVVPVCHHPADAATLEIIAEQYPGRDIVGLDVGPVLAYGGGGIHCITQQVPEVG